MRHIYFKVANSYSEHILAKKGVTVNGEGYYYVTDILGRDHCLPIVNTYLFEEEWDGNPLLFSNRFTNIIKELNGESTGTLKNNRDD